MIIKSAAILQEGKTLLLNEGPGYGINQSVGEAPLMLGMWSTASLPTLPGSVWPGVVAPESVLSMGQIELFDI